MVEPGMARVDRVLKIYRGNAGNFYGLKREGE
jgi:hypothetical protein